MTADKFDPARAERLNDPRRLEMLRPDVLWEALAVPEPRVVVDVGAGTGLVTAAFARLAPAAQFYAADVSPDMLAFLREHLPAEVASRVTPVQAMETVVPLATGFADAVVMIGVYHEFDRPTASLAEAHRLLGHHGRLLIADWKKGAAVAGFGPPDHNRVSADEIAAELRAAGFSDVEEHDALERFSVVTATRA